MGELTGALVPLALGIAVSPVPLAALGAILLTAPSSRPGIGFLAGWVTGILAALVLFTNLPSIVPDTDHASFLSAGVVTAALGCCLVLLGTGQAWRASRRHRAAAPRRSQSSSTRTAGWTTRVTALTFPRAAVVALVMSLNPKGLAVSAGAGLQLHAAELSAAPLAVAAAAYTVASASTVAVPVTARTLAGDHATRWLRPVQDWSSGRSTVVTAVVLLVLGVLLVARGLTSI